MWGCMAVGGPVFGKARYGSHAMREQRGSVGHGFQVDKLAFGVEFGGCKGLTGPKTAAASIGPPRVKLDQTLPLFIRPTCGKATGSKGVILRWLRVHWRSAPPFCTRSVLGGGELSSGRSSFGWSMTKDPSHF